MWPELFHWVLFSAKVEKNNMEKLYLSKNRILQKTDFLPKISVKWRKNTFIYGFRYVNNEEKS